MRPALKLIAYISALGVLLCLLLMLLETEASSVEVEEPAVEIAVVADPAELMPAIDPLQAEKEAVAKTIYGEARGCSVAGQEDVVWTILTRYDDGRFGDTILDVITRQNQFHGYDTDNPVLPEHFEVAERIINRWLDGDPGPGWLYFYGDGQVNHFRR